MLIRPGIELGNLTDTGCHRPENEDYYCYAEPESDQDFERKGRLAVVADGMGGHAGGQIASAIAVERVREVYFGDPSEDPNESLRAALSDAHAAIQNCARQHPELMGMGTTCTCAVVRDRQLYYGHVGDSRLYLIRNSSISRITEDQTLVGRLLREGAISAEEAAVHPEKNVLTAALGMEPAVPAEFPEAPVPLQENDILLMCTDGLHGLVSDEELLGVATSNPAREACQELIRLAKERGGFDNITVQILRVL